jgi:O-succinylbenzoic acid--CoA ligase
MTKKHNPALHEIQIHYSGQKWKFDDFVASEAVNNQYLSSIINFIKKWESGQEHFNQKTSGSTSKPKTISISRNQMIASANCTLKTLGLQPGDKVMLNINPEYIGGKMILVRALIGHLDLIVGELSGNPLKNYHEDFNIDFFSFVPYQLENIIDKSPEKISILN